MSEAPGARVAAVAQLAFIARGVGIDAVRLKAPGVLLNERETATRLYQSCVQ